MNLSKEILTTKIENVEDAKKFLLHLSSNEKLFHPDDSAFEVECFSNYEAYHINNRMNECLSKDFLWGKYEDIYGFIISLIYK